MSFRSIVCDVRDSFGSLSRRSFDVKLIGHHHRGKSHGSVQDLHDQPLVIQNSCWASLLPELLFDVIRRLEESENTWPSREHVVACASVCQSWRNMCKDIVKSPEFCGKLTFPVSLKQPGPRDGIIQCFIKRDKSNLTYHLFLCLSPTWPNGKYTKGAKYGKQFEKYFNPDISKAYRNIDMDTRTINQIIANHFYRQGLFDVGDHFLSAVGEPEPAAIMKSPFLEMYQILQAMQNQNLEPALNWAVTNSDKLAQSGSDIVLKLHSMQFVKILQNGGSRDEALHYARTHPFSFC
ncbi:unnamed protein product [Lathyrus sativus]|nr:unnamed protein product [Lathyrus sativus]